MNEWVRFLYLTFIKKDIQIFNINVHLANGK